jgi:hypothetical protein
MKLQIGPVWPGGLAMLRQFIVSATSTGLVIGTVLTPVTGQPAAPLEAAGPDQAAPAQGGEVEKFSAAQLDALLAPIALYPDPLLTQVLMAATFPLEIVAASRWLAQGNNNYLQGQALEDALTQQPWDPSVKSLVPFPQVLDMLNTQLEFTQQVGFAMQVQEPEVFEAVQRLRAQALAAGNLTSTPQQIVQTVPAPGAAGPPDLLQQVITIEPAHPNMVFVPAYDPNQVYGAWAYPDIQPVYLPSPPDYGYGHEVAAGLLFGAGVAVVPRLWGWAQPNWGWRGYGSSQQGFGSVSVNVNRWNAIGVNRSWNGRPDGTWQPNHPNFQPGSSAALVRPGGPVGRPATPGGLLPSRASPENRLALPFGLEGAHRPGLPPALGPGNRPSFQPEGRLGNRSVPLAGRAEGNLPNVPSGNRPVTGLVPAPGQLWTPGQQWSPGPGVRSNVPGNVLRPAGTPSAPVRLAPQISRPPVVAAPAPVRLAPQISRPPVVAAPAPMRPAPQISRPPVVAAPAPMRPAPQISRPPVVAAPAPMRPAPQISRPPVVAAPAPMRPAPQISRSPVAAAPAPARPAPQISRRG